MMEGNKKLLRLYLVPKKFEKKYKGKKQREKEVGKKNFNLINYFYILLQLYSYLTILHKD